MLELLDTIGFGRIHAGPTLELFWVLFDVVGDQFVGDPDARSFGLQAEHHHLVSGFGRLPMIFRLGIVRVSVEPRGVGLST